MHDDYTWSDFIWGKGITYGLFTSLLGSCGVMGLHMSIALIGLDWDCEWKSCNALMKWTLEHEMLIQFYYDATLEHEYEYVLMMLWLWTCICSWNVHKMNVMKF